MNLAKLRQEQAARAAGKLGKWPVRARGRSQVRAFGAKGRKRVRGAEWIMVIVLLASLWLCGTASSLAGDVATGSTAMRLRAPSGEWADPLEGVGMKALVFVFVSVECPISNGYAPKLRRIANHFAARGVELRLVYPNSDEGGEEISAHQKEYDLPFKAYWDPEHELTEAAGAKVTPESAIYAPGKGWVYCGRIDDRHAGFGLKRPAATSEDLQVALRAVLEGKEVPQASSRAIGCAIPGQS